jgi:hypothetical protein
MDRTLSSFLQLVTLVLGIAIGVLVAPRFNKAVSAQSDVGQGAASNSSSETSPNIVYIQSYQSGPAIAATVVLAHDLQADHAVVNGYDLLKIDEGIINYLGTLPMTNPTTLNSIVSNSRATTQYRIRPYTPRPTPLPNGQVTPPKP